MTEICSNVEKTKVSLPPINGHREFTRYKISGDGKCGYHAISVWVKKNRPDQYDAILATFENPPKYPILAYLQQYIEGLRTATTVKDKVKKQCGYGESQMVEAIKRVENGDWMETAELSILCCLLGLMAYVYDDTNPKGLEWTIIEPRNDIKQDEDNKIYLYNERKTHFDLLTPIEIIDLVNEKEIDGSIFFLNDKYNQSNAPFARISKLKITDNISGEEVLFYDGTLRFSKLSVELVIKICERALTLEKVKQGALLFERVFEKFEYDKYTVEVGVYPVGSKRGIHIYGKKINSQWDFDHELKKKGKKKRSKSKTRAKRKKKEKPRKSVCDDYGVCVVQFQKIPTISLKF